MISTHLNQCHRIKGACKYKHCDIISILRLEMLKFAYFVIKNVAIYACSSGKFLNYGKYACVKDLTNIMSVLAWILTKVLFGQSEKYKIPGSCRRLEQA